MAPQGDAGHGRERATQSTLTWVIIGSLTVALTLAACNERRGDEIERPAGGWA